MPENRYRCWTLWNKFCVFSIHAQKSAIITIRISQFNFSCHNFRHFRIDETNRKSNFTIQSNAKLRKIDRYRIYVSNKGFSFFVASMISVPLAIDMWHFLVWKRTFSLVIVFISSAIQFWMNNCDHIHPEQEDEKHIRSNSIHEINPFIHYNYSYSSKRKKKCWLLSSNQMGGIHLICCLNETLYRWNNGNLEQLRN